MVGEDWINILILEGKVIVDIDAMDSGVIVDHNDNIFLSSVNTMGYTTKNTMAGVAHNNGKTMVKGFAGANNLTSTPMDQEKVPQPRVRRWATPRAISIGKSRRSSLHWLPPVLWERIKNEPSAVPAPNYSGWDEQKQQ